MGVPVAERGPAVEEVLPVLRRLWAGERVSHDGPSGSFTDVSISPLPVQDPLEIWLGGTAHTSLVRCGRLADGWLPAMCTPAEAADGRRVVEDAAAQAGRSVSAEHFGVSIGYSTGPLNAQVAEALSARTRGRPLADLVPESVTALREILGRYLDVGFSKFVLRPLMPPDDWRGELDRLAAAVGDLQN